MLSIKNVLPNLFKTLIVTMAASLSISAFAGDAHTGAPKELSVEEVSPSDNNAAENLELTAEEAEAKAKMEEELKNAQ